jgi:hypothetical protein
MERDALRGLVVDGHRAAVMSTCFAQGFAKFWQ